MSYSSSPSRKTPASTPFTAARIAPATSAALTPCSDARSLSSTTRISGCPGS
jgi:hypothetical protein